jgi:hypothetical protein
MGVTPALPVFCFCGERVPATITLEQTSEWAKRFLFRRPLALGNFNEPAVTSANLILQTILGAPFRWRWNRAVTGFVCSPGIQDYTLFNWQATTPVLVGYTLLDSNGFSQTVTTAGTTGSTIPTFNSTVGGTTTDGSVIWTNSGLVGLANGSTAYSFAWIENASVKVTNPNSCNMEWKQITPHIDLALDSAQSTPHSISAQFNVGNSITFRLMPTPDKAYPVSIQIQQTPPIINSLQNTWAPIPDEYSRIYNWGFLALMYLYADDPRFASANQKFITNLLSTQEGLTETELNIWMNNWEQITGTPLVKNMDFTQGRQGRGNL